MIVLYGFQDIRIHFKNIVNCLHFSIFSEMKGINAQHSLKKFSTKVFTISMFCFKSCNVAASFYLSRLCIWYHIRLSDSPSHTTPARLLYEYDWLFTLLNFIIYKFNKSQTGGSCIASTNLFHNFQTQPIVS